ncbi:MAG TPA: NAD-binding protein [Candidatus Dormibacteraeota bacterium]|nr:NAD-binding protein [Candidatus Dormibacteraeota bacterium]
MILVLGCTRLGARLTKALRSAAQEVVIVERNRRYLEQYLSDDYGSAVVLGPPTDPEVLDRAGVERADMVCIVNRDDALNVLLADLLRTRYPSKRILLRLDDPALTQIYRDSGFEVVSPLDLAVNAFTHSIVPVTGRL